MPADIAIHFIHSTHTHARMHACTHARTHTHTHAHTHTHTLVLPSFIFETEGTHPQTQFFQFILARNQKQKL